MPILSDVLIAPGEAAAWREAASALAAALAASSILLGLMNCRAALLETTLIYAWWWSVAACAVIAGVEIAGVFLPEYPAWLSPLRFCAAALSFCPLISMLGSKRPQHVAWNFVVLALWGIVSLSALTALAMQRSDRFVLGDARAWLLVVLILIGLANYLPTSNWLAALLVATGQILLFASHLPLLREFPFLANPAASASLALLLFALALITFRVSSRWPQERADPFDRLWLDFRDLFGLLWSLRLQERVNAAAHVAGWQFELAWGGFVKKEDSQEAITPTDPGTPTQSHGHGAQRRYGNQSELRPVMTGLLRRFVSHEWIAARLREDID